MWLACRLSTIKCQHLAADMTYPPHLEQREKRATTDIKLVPLFDRRQAAAATAQNTGAVGENMQRWYRVDLTELKDYYSFHITALDIL